MASGDIEAIKKDLVDINDFVKERFDPVTKQVDLLKDETERIKREIADTQQRARTPRRNALTRYVEDQSGVVVPEGPYSGMDVLDLALVRSFAYSQRREAFGPAWIDRAEEAKRLLTSAVTPGTIQASHQSAADRLRAWYTVDSKSTGQFEGFGRSLLQSLTRAAMDSTTAGVGDELVVVMFSILSPATAS